MIALVVRLVAVVRKFYYCNLMLAAVLSYLFNKIINSLLHRLHFAGGAGVCISVI